MLVDTYKSKTAVGGFNLYTYRNYYGAIMFAIAAVDAMPAKYLEIVFTGSFDEAQRRHGEKIISN
jgi:hypothetical protein